MILDDGRMTELMEASADLHSDAMHLTGAALTEMVELGNEARQHPGSLDAVGGDDPTRRTFLQRSLFAAGTVAGAGFGAALLGRASTTTVYADAAGDVELLQTAASIENLAVAVYQKAAGLPAWESGASNPLLLQFVTTTIKQHTEHAAAFNAAISALGGKTQSGIDTVVDSSVVTPALARITKPADVLGLALTLEEGAAQTYVKFGGLADSPQALTPFATIAPVEAQHAAVLLAVKSLLDGGAPLASITLPPADLGTLPAALGSVGFPTAFTSIELARPTDEGAVK